MLRNSLQRLSSDWSNIEHDLDTVDEELTSCLRKWEEHNARLQSVNSELKSIEAEARQIAAKATLDDKQEALQHLRSLHADVTSLNRDVHELNDGADALAALTSDSRVTNATSLSANRHQTLSQSLSEQVRRWEQVCADHYLYEEELHNCVEWHKDVSSRLLTLTNTDADRVSIENKLLRLQVSSLRLPL